VIELALKLLITNGSKTIDIIHLAQTITWSGDYQQCSRTLEFSIVSSYTDKNIPDVICELGNAISFMQNNRLLFSGYIFERQKGTDSSVINITCYDNGFYLKRNEGTYKFMNLAPEAITKKVCEDFNIAIGSVVTTGVKITRNFIGVSLYKIIQTAYTLASEKTGKQYMIRFSGSKLTVIEKNTNDETLIIEGGSNLMSASCTESISNMINQVAIYNKDDKLIGTQKDVNAIKLYGLMQNYIKQADGEDVTNKAKKIITDNGVTQKITVNNLGNVANITGGTVVVKEPYSGAYGLFYIDGDIHTWKLGQYYNKLILNFKNIMDGQEAGSLPNKNGSKTEDKSETWDYIYKPGGVDNG
jgi:hypothetical protein